MLDEAKKLEFEQKAYQKIQEALVEVVLMSGPECVFFYVLMSNLKKVPKWNLNPRTAATEGTHIFYDPEFICSLSKAMITGLLIHEVMHVALMHMTRKNGRAHLKWNIACDAAINYQIRQTAKKVQDGRSDGKIYIDLPKSGVFAGEGIFHYLPLNLSAEEYYTLIKDEDAEKFRGTGFGEVIEAGDGDEATIEKIENEVKIALNEAIKAAEMIGKLPDSISRNCNNVLNPQKDWREILREFVNKSAKNDYNWGTPNRRYIGSGLYLPGIRGEEIGDIAICVDTSGSIGQADLDAFTGELDGVLQAYTCKVHILYHDSEVAHEQEWESDDGPIKMEAKGGGGTSHIPVLKRAAELDPVICICFTDLYSVFPTKVPSFPVLWLSTVKDKVGPFGDTAFLKV